MENISDTKKHIQSELNAARNVLTFSQHEVAYYDLLLKKEEAEESLTKDIELLSGFRELSSKDESEESNQTKRIITEWCLTGLKKVKSLNMEIDEVKEKRCKAAKKLVNKRCD